MTVFTPPYAPSYSTPVRKTYRRLENSFGDGYEQLVQDGLNNVSEVWDNVWNNISDEAGDVIEDYLDQFAGTTFQWTTPKGITKYFSCKDFTRTFVGYKTCSISATFTESFNIA